MLDIVDFSNAKSAGQAVARQMWDQFHPAPCTDHGVDEEDAEEEEEDFENRSASSNSSKDDSNEHDLSHSEDVVTAPVVRKVSSVIALGHLS